VAGTRWTVGADEAGLRLDKFLSSPERLGSRGRAMDALERGKVFRNDVEQGRRDAAARLVDGDAVRVWMDRPGTATRRGATRGGEVRILFEDASLVVVDKPAGLLAVPLPARDEALSVVDVLERHLRSRGKRHPLVVHRIDRDTSGVVVFAKEAHAQARLKDQVRRREPERVYLAVVYGHPDPSSGVWRDHLVWDRESLIQKETHPRDPRASEAISHYRVLESFAEASLIEVRLRTGRRNQIRLQARLRGHTLVGERRYVYGPEAIRPIPFARQALHAHRLAFLHPVSGQRLTFESPLPDDMRELIERLRATR
jgi:23S rRNA pseudouridine1911/1915/1917 synthase